MRVEISVVAVMEERVRILIVPGRHTRAEAIKLTDAPEGSQVWTELYDTDDPVGEATRLASRAQELRKYLMKHTRDLPKTDP